MKENEDAFLNSQEVPQTEKRTPTSEYPEVHKVFTLPIAEIPTAINELVQKMKGNESGEALDLKSDLSRELAMLVASDSGNVDKETLFQSIQRVRHDSPNFDEFLQEVADIAYYMTAHFPGDSDGVSYDDRLFPERLDVVQEHSTEMETEIHFTHKQEHLIEIKTNLVLDILKKYGKDKSMLDIHSFLTQGEQIEENLKGELIGLESEVEEEIFKRIVDEYLVLCIDSDTYPAALSLYQYLQYTVLSNNEAYTYFVAQVAMNVNKLPEYSDGAFFYKVMEAIEYRGGLLRDIIDSLDFENSDNYNVTSALLEYLKSLAVLMNDSYDSAKKLVSEMATMLDTKINSPQDSSLLLKLRAEQISKNLGNEGVVEHDQFPFLLDNTTFAYSNRFGVDISHPEDFEEIKKLVLEIRRAYSQYNLTLESIPSLDEQIDFSKPSEYANLDGIFRLRRELSSYFEDELSVDSRIGIEVNFNNKREKQSACTDYQFLLSPAVRKEVQDMTGVHISELTIQEQFYFLNYIKYTTVESAGTMKDFLSHYGIDAMRSFLANSYDENASENIMVFGTMIEPEIANEMFGAYAQSIDSTHALTSSFQTYADNLSKTEGVPETVSTEAKESVALLRDIEEGMLKRAGHLFGAGKQMSLWEYGGEEQTLDLIEAYKGVAKMQDMLARVGSSEGMHITRNSDREGGKNPLHDIGAETFFFNIEDTKNNEQLDFKVTIRPQANENGEARINFELYLDKLPEDSTLRQAFQQRTEFLGAPGKGRKRTVEKSVIRFGFDLDTNDNPPVFSFDMGRGVYNSENMRRTGDVLGKILSNVAPEGSHLTDFDESFSNPENFQKIATEFKRYFQNVPLVNQENLVTESAREAA